MFGWFKKNEKIKNPVISHSNLGVTPNSIMINEEKELLNVFLISLIEKLSLSPEVNENKINEIKSLVKEDLEPFARKNIKKILNSGNPLSLNQKKELGFNSRLKICEDYLNFINLNNINKEDPFEFLTNAEFYAKARSWSNREIQRAKSIGSKQVKLTVCKESCSKSTKVKKIYNINEAPLLPLKTCGNRCLCMYTVVVEF